MDTLTNKDLDFLALGAAILGSGGGGSPSYNLLMAKYCFSVYHPPKILELSALTDDDLVVPIAFMGAPMVAMEKLASGKEWGILLNQIEKHCGRKATALLSAEIGGANALTALIAGAMTGVPVIDGDLIGRAFPELQMSVCTLHDIAAAPAFLVDALGNSAVITAKNPFDVERLARQVVIGMGSRAAVALYLMSGREAKSAVIRGSLSKAIEIGRIITIARETHMDPTEALLEGFGGIELASGVIEDIDYEIKGGFLCGKAVLVDAKGIGYSIHYRNEYLLARQAEDVIGSTPDIIMLLEQETGTPITSSDLAFGQRVDLVLLPSPEIWKTPEGIALVGPDNFNF